MPFSDSYPHPKAMSEGDIKHVEDAFVAAVERCKSVGCRVLRYFSMADTD